MDVQGIPISDDLTSCAVLRHITPAGVDLPGNCCSSRCVELGVILSSAGKPLPHNTLGGFYSTYVQPGFGQWDSPQARIPTRLAHATALGTVVRRRGLAGTRVRALNGERRGRLSPHRLLAVDGHRRTFPRLREALDPLPAAVGIDAVSA